MGALIYIDLERATFSFRLDDAFIVKIAKVAKTLDKRASCWKWASNRSRTWKALNCSGNANKYNT